MIWTIVFLKNIKMEQNEKILETEKNTTKNMEYHRVVRCQSNTNTSYHSAASFGTHWYDSNANNTIKAI